MAKNIKPRPKQAPTDTDHSVRLKIMKTAEELFAERGLAGVSIRDISTAAGTNIALISYYFGGKEELYRTLIREHALNATSNIGGLLHQFKGKDLTKKMFSEILTQLIYMIVKTQIENPAISRIFQQERLQGLPYAREVYETIVTPLALQLCDLIREAQRQKIVDPDLIPEMFFVTLTESIWGYFVVSDCNLKITRSCIKLPKETQAYVEFLQKLFLKGVML